MESLLLENLRKNQIFAAAVKKNNRIDQLSNQVLRAVLGPNQPDRKKALDGLEHKIVNYFGKEIQPAARAQGVANAKAVVTKLGPAPNLDDPALRRQILVDGNVRPADRLRIVQAIVNDKTNTLDNRLTAYWLEPGRNPREKLEHLKELHFEQERKRLAYERELAAFHVGSETKRPAKPQLDFMSKFTSDVKGGVLEQARRSGTDAETETFVKAGETQFAWVTVNASEPCPDCKKRQGIVGDSKFWDAKGKPGSGHTVCGTSCYCMLVPSRTLTKHPSLQKGLEVPPVTALPAMPGTVPVAAPVQVHEPVTILPPAPVAMLAEPIPAKPKPIIGYHGSPKRFNAFEVRPGDTENKFGPGVYFAPEKQDAVSFVTNAAAPGVPYHLYKADVEISKVLDAGQRLSDEHFAAINKAAAELGHVPIPEDFKGGRGGNLYKLLTTINQHSNATANKILQHAGFEGVQEPGEFVVFDPKKISIKSVKTYHAK